jgi:ribonuclease BN (tRNA processing enzyme)
VAPDGATFLIDCGSDARRSLFHAGYFLTDISKVYISHLHSDHIGGLELLALRSKFDSRCSKPELYLPESLITPLWENSLKGGLSTLAEKVSLETYFKVIPCVELQPFSWQGLQLTPFFSYHAPQEDGYMPCFGLWIESEKTKIFLSNDSQYTPEYHEQRFQAADYIFHDCETGEFKSGVHAHYTELIQMAPDIKKKTYLYHYEDRTLYDAPKDGFAGFVLPGQIIEFE